MAVQPQQHGTDRATGLYPERPGEPVCVYYLRNGLCGYGMNCRFNHPQIGRLGTATIKNEDGYSGKTELQDTLLSNEKEEISQKIGQPECRHYLKNGICKFGETCHPRNRAGSYKGQVQLNSLGLPIRLGEKSCTYYARTGYCKFGLNCKFHHPQPGTMSTMLPLSSFYLYRLGTHPQLVPVPYQESIATWSVARASYLPGLRLPSPTGCVPMIFPLQGPAPGWNTYEETELPERVGEPDCHYYLRTGNYKFGTACKFHHPRGRDDSPSPCSLSITGLPLRPGEPHCSFYSRYGICKFGPTCKFDHPIGRVYNTLASTVVAMPVAPSAKGPSTTSITSSEVSYETEKVQELLVLSEEEATEVSENGESGTSGEQTPCEPVEKQES